MNIVICGDGRLGSAIAHAASNRGDRPAVLGRPTATHPPDALEAADVVVDASRPDAVATNLEAAIDAGARRFVIATTGWGPDAARVEALLLRAGAAAVIAPNMSLGAAVFMRLIERAAGDFAAVPGFEPFVWEWHRRGKADRPSGTARELVRRIARADPRAANLEVASVRAGASPGVHVVGFDASGETIELRISARDRSSYAAGALAAADWLMATPRRPGPHDFEAVVADLLGRANFGHPALAASA
jgi:4-hydroxy-tetrahydrodipicolinate reductase